MVAAVSNLGLPDVAEVRGVCVTDHVGRRPWRHMRPALCLPLVRPRFFLEGPVLAAA